MNRYVRLYGFGILIVMTLIVSACGSNGGLGDLGSVNTTDMTSDQATSFSKSISRISTSAVSAQALRANELSNATSQQRANTQINQSISYTLTCTSGGNMKASGNITGSISDTGSGIIQLQIPITITDWSCQPPLIINGDPYISITGTFTFLNGAPSTQQHLGIHGGFKSETQSCQISLDTNFNTTGGGHTTGTVCGHSVDFTF
ncbi:MAG: hypothetical protein M0R70_14430 [Nitrospirae bacterium]|nr:hypothetical protein [Nitrospirota bacterium]